MSKPYQLIVFDWEGTLGEDSVSYMLSVLSTAAQSLHLGDMDLSVARNCVSLGLATAVKKLYPDAQMHQQEELLLEVQRALVMSSSAVRLMRGALETVQWLQSKCMHLGIATNKSHQGLMRALRGSGLDAYFQVTRSADETEAKPCPQMLEEIMATFGVSAEQTLMVGDSIMDMEMAVALGVDAIGLDFFHMESESLYAAGALHVFDNFEQLLCYLKE